MRRNKLCIYLHLVWATRNREPIITPSIERQLHRFVSIACERRGCSVLAVGGMPDHIHVLLSLANTVSISELMRDVKGSSSRYATDDLLNGQWFEWQANYGAFSVSVRDIKRVIDYVTHQKQHHDIGHVWPHAEDTCDVF